MAYRVGLSLFSVALIIGLILGVGLPVAGLCSGRCCWLNKVISLMNSHFQPYPYHLVEPSPWPLAASMSLLTCTLSAVLAFHGYSYGGPILTMGLLATLATIWLWVRDILVEGTYQGHHTLKVQRSLIIGFILFIVSEVAFFFSIFWAFFDSALAPTVEIGCHWPPAGIQPINPWGLPLLNTILLLSSGATVTWSHHSLIAGQRQQAIMGLILTIALALIFTGVQGFEFYEAPFTISDGSFGSCFFFATGAHGLHVLVGTIFLIVALFRLINYHLTHHHHVGYEAGILYWHKMPS
jgi:cytochrome c oxidase subunit 3